MATLNELMDLILQMAEARQRPVDADFFGEVKVAVRQRFGNDRIYVSPPGSRKDGERTEAIRAAAKKLPTGVVKERFGVSRQYVSRITKK